jgi:hypothetical protein
MTGKIGVEKSPVPVLYDRRLPTRPVKQTSWFFSEKFLDRLDPHILIIHEEPTKTEHKLTLRFQNGFGIEILQSFLRGEPPVFELLVVKFLGARMKDFEPIRCLEADWFNSPEEIIHLCQQVAGQPARAAV